MTRQPHDQFAKQYLEELLAPLGEVEISREIAGEVRQVDICFAPNPTADREILGLLGKMVSTPCLLEPFRNQPSKTEIRSCMVKLFSLHSELQRKARREDEELPEAELPRLWILATSASAALLDSFGARLDPDNWPIGVYFLADALKTAVVAINQLPLTEQTLWLRILGKGTTQQQAINEITALPPENPLRRNVLELISTWRINVERKDNLTEDERELIMNLTPAYLEWRENTLREGVQEGVREGSLQERRLVVGNLLRLRFDSVDEELSRVIEPLLKLPPEEYSRLLLQLSREDLLARFGIE
ncbi:hypothetical protein [Argonema antarcticum]|uniref:hypothetical protein n=1 Tax=Argonema antarcticum TaxID=2942763 RepID=UPI0020135133|nr:hypothetical protein [Argonema antarcticum]MCL1471649.1 hypothetical protein [Argonema antarcticum A004/B2]